MQSIHVIDEAINCIRQQMLYSVTRILWLAFCGSWRVCWVFELGELGVAVYREDWGLRVGTSTHHHTPSHTTTHHHTQPHTATQQRTPPPTTHHHPPPRTTTHHHTPPHQHTSTPAHQHTSLTPHIHMGVRGARGVRGVGG